MRLPVSRARFDLLSHNYEHARETCVAYRVQIGALEAELDRETEASKSWQALFEAERIRNDGLVQKLLDLKQQGFTTAAQRQQLPPVEPSRVELAIQEKAGTNRALSRYLTNVAHAMERARKSEDEIVEAVTVWRDPDADEASP